MSEEGQQHPYACVLMTGCRRTFSSARALIEHCKDAHGLVLSESPQAYNREPEPALKARQNSRGNDICCLLCGENLVGRPTAYVQPCGHAAFCLDCLGHYWALNGDDALCPHCKGPLLGINKVGK